MNIHAKTIPHKRQRYETVGDFVTKNGITRFTISEMKNDDFERLVFLHEFIEEWLTRKRGISQEEIDAFDIKFEAEREQGLHGDDEEPGFDKRAPYRREHAFATKIEKKLARELGVNWKQYDKTVMSL